MKRDKKFILASAAGLAAIAGFFAVRYFLRQDSYSYRANIHNYFNDFTEEDCHGVEFFSLR